MIMDKQRIFLSNFYYHFITVQFVGTKRVEIDEWGRENGTKGETNG